MSRRDTSPSAPITSGACRARPRSPERGRARGAAAAPDRLRAVENASILEAMELQRAAGLPTGLTASCGAHRGTWTSSIGSEGVQQLQDEAIHVAFRDAEGECDYAPAAMRVTSRITLPATS